MRLEGPHLFVESYNITTMASGGLSLEFCAGMREIWESDISHRLNKNQLIQVLNGKA